MHTAIFEFFSISTSYTANANHFHTKLLYVNSPLQILCYMSIARWSGNVLANYNRSVVQKEEGSTLLQIWVNITLTCKQWTCEQAITCHKTMVKQKKYPHKLPKHSEKGHRVMLYINIIISSILASIEGCISDDLLMAMDAWLSTTGRVRWWLVESFITTTTPSILKVISGTDGTG